MVMIQAGSHAHSATSDMDSKPQAGPVFVPSRRPSAFARQLMEQTVETDDAVTAYDELWFTGRPTV